MTENWEVKPLLRYCRNCGTILSGYRNSQGVLRLRCPQCGLEEVGRKLGRRHERCDFYAPPDNDIDN